MIIYFLPMILFLGIITSYQDIKIGKIRNKWIISAIIYTIILYTFLITYFLIAGEVFPSYLLELLTNFLFTILIGFGLWFLNLWTAGDGKLFIAFATLLPLTVYVNQYYKFIPSFTLLINIFWISLISMFFHMIFKSNLKDLKIVLKSFIKEFFDWRYLLRSIAALFAILWLMEIILKLINLNNTFLRFGLTILIFALFKKGFGKNTMKAMIVLSIIRLLIDKTVYSWTFLINFLILVLMWKLIMSFLRGIIGKFGQEIFSKEYPINKLKPGMVLSEFIEEKEKLDDKEISQLKKQNIKIIKHNNKYYLQKSKTLFNLNNFIEEEAEGLTKKQIKVLKNIGIKKIKVSQTIPFAPLMFIGTLLTIIAKGNILIFIKTIFS